MDNKTEKELKGRKLMSEADKKLSSFNGIFGTIVGKSSAIDEAIDLYLKAGIQLKMAQKWDVAAKAICCAARLQARSDQKHESALNFVSAANCFRKFDAKQAIDCLLKAISYYESMGRFSTSAKHYVTVADIYQTQLSDTEKAVESYELAANHFKADNSITSANKCLLNSANYWALQHNYQKAIEIYEEIAFYCIESPLLKYSANNHFMRAALCHTSIDLLNGELALKRYEDSFPSFGDSRESKLVKNLISSLENGDIDGYSELIRQYDTVSRFDNWFITILLEIKRKYNCEDIDPDMK